MDSWILFVLILILLELMWIGSRLPTGSQDLVGELKKIQEELYWFKDDKFAGHLLKEMNSNVGAVIESLDRIKRSLDQIEDGLTTTNLSLDELKEIASTQK